jgi:ribosomal protection tetracycline resistance protein
LSQRTLNLGILAHVDAGKTTLTERLLYAAGVIDEPGSVDAGTTQTDSMALERQRGITIRAAVASFAIGDVRVNLIDTPGHPDFIAEVERALAVLDGAVLVISAVEGVQPQTRVLMRALQRLQVPTMLFVNKIDRPGADIDRTLQAVARRLTDASAVLQEVEAVGSPCAGVVARTCGAPGFRDEMVELLAPFDDALLSAYVDEARIGAGRLHRLLARATGEARVHPVLFGSALTGAGVEQLMAAVVDLLPTANGDPSEPLSGVVFKVDRADGGEKIAYARLFTGSLTVRDRVSFGAGAQAKVTGLELYGGGPARATAVATAGSVVRVRGLRQVRVGDRIGSGAAPAAYHFPPPTLESVAAPVEASDGARLRAALAELADQDPLIAVRQDDRSGEISVSLYGEVQKQVIGALLEADYGIAVTFRGTTPAYVERVVGRGEWVEALHAESNPYAATIGFRVEPGAPGSGIAFFAPVEHSEVPLLVYKRPDLFVAAMRGYVTETLQRGLHGWRVTDCVVTLIRCGYSVADGPPSRRGPTSTAADFRKLTPIVLRRALKRAGTVVCEPTLQVTVEAPAVAVGNVVAAASRLGGAVTTSEQRGDLAVLDTVLSGTDAQRLRAALPGITGGEGVMETVFAGYAPVRSGDRILAARSHSSAG